MTVKFIENGDAACTWFDKAKKEEARFKLAQLELAN